MNVTPLDLRQQQFRIVDARLRQDEVMAFLAEAADDYEEALREADRLRQDVTRLEGPRQRAPRARAEPAQHAADGAAAGRRNQRQRAQAGRARSSRTPSRAPSLILEKAQARYEDVQREIDGLRLKRREVENSVEAMIATLQATRSSSCASRTPASATRRSCCTGPAVTDSRESRCPGWSQDRKDRHGPVVIERRG